MHCFLEFVVFFFVCYLLDSLKNTIILSIVFIFSWDLQWSQEKLETMLMQNFGGTNEEYYGIFDTA